MDAQLDAKPDPVARQTRGPPTRALGGGGGVKPTSDPYRSARPRTLTGKALFR
jgi:hypothetical protein